MFSVEDHSLSTTTSTSTLKTRSSYQSNIIISAVTDDNLQHDAAAFCWVKFVQRSWRFFSLTSVQSEFEHSSIWWTLEELQVQVTWLLLSPAGKLVVLALVEEKCLCEQSVR